MKKSTLAAAALLSAATALAGVRLENRFVTLEIGDDATVRQLAAKDTGASLAAAKVPFVGAVMRDGSFVPAVQARGDDRAIDFELADGGRVSLLVTSFGDGWLFETRNAALKGAKELRFVRAKALAADGYDLFVRAAHLRTALRDEDGVRSAAALCGWGFDQHRALLAAAPKDYRDKLEQRMGLVGGKEAVRKAGPWAEDLVANPTIDVPESWRPKKIAGRDFRASITDLLIGHYGGMDRLPDCEAFRHAIINISSFYDVRDFAGRDFRVNEKKRTGPYTIEEALATSSRAKEICEGVAKSSDMLFTVGMEIRPLANLTAESFGADVADFKRWRAANPRFLGFRGFSETDNDFNGYYRQATATLAGKKAKAAKKVDGKRTSVECTVPEAVLARYPITGDQKVDSDLFMRTAWKQMRKVYFDSDEIMGLYSINMALCQKYAQIGVRVLACEVAINAVAGPWAWSGGFLRGAARQWDRIPSWYMARYQGLVPASRDGRLLTGDQRWPRGVRPNFEPYHGAGRSFNRRGMFYGWAMGASTLALEGDCLCFLEDAADGKTCGLSVYGREFNDVFELNERVDRGVAYTPIALVGSIDEVVSRHCYPNGRLAPYAHSAFLYTLVPVKVPEALLHCARDKGDQGGFRNSRFGEIWDYLTCDSGQDHAAFAAALSRYPVAFLVGKFDEKTFDAKAVEEYVKNGGTLFVTADNVRPGLVEPSLAGVTYGEEKLPFRIGKFDYTAIKPSATAADTTFFDTAFTSTNANLFTSRRVGKGRVVTCAVERYLPDVLRHPVFDNPKVKGWQEVVSGEIDFPLVRELLTKVQGETIPFEVRGRCQWGVNKTAKGWLVWMMNNAGVTKFAGEPEEFDMAEKSRVTVVSKLTGEAKSVEIEPGGIAYLEF